MSGLPIIDALTEYKNKNIDYYAMPGHKMGRVFQDCEEGRQFIKNIIEYDITEVNGMDNLHNPEGIIKESLQHLTEYYNSRKSYYLVNGSTSGNMIMIFSAFNDNDKIIVERNCHKSIYNGIILRKLKPVYIENEINNDYDAPLSISREHLFKLIKDNRDAKGIILTYPNYYGVCTNLKEIVDEAKKYNMMVLVDSAHGAHFGVTDKLPGHANSMGCDMVVNSAHKTLPSLTQTSYLHVNNEALIDRTDFYMSMFSTTSPSYLFMCTLEYSRYYLQKYGYDKYNKLIALCESYRKKINTSEFFHIIDDEDIPDTLSKGMVLIDKSRYVISVPKGYSGHKFAEYLYNNNIQVEMNDERSVVLIFSPVNDERDFNHLYEVLIKCPKDQLKGQYVPIVKSHIPEMKYLPWEVISKKSCRCAIDDSEGKICGQAVIPYPPGVPLIMPGELIDKEIIESIRLCIDNSIDILGIDNNQINVINE